jgi:hypothetical protein
MKLSNKKNTNLVAYHQHIVPHTPQFNHLGLYCNPMMDFKWNKKIC